MSTQLPSTKVISPALQALIENLIDYAGTFPPASATLDEAIENYNGYKKGNHAWLLRSIVVNAADVPNVPASLDGSLAVLADADENRATSLETKAVVVAQRPVYCEVALNATSELDAIKKAGCFAKIRTGGLTPDAIPSTAELAAFILACAERKLAFKATAGLHHARRNDYLLTYEPDAPRAVMHGFLNVLLASAFAWNGEKDIEPILAEVDPFAFYFDGRAHWRSRTLEVEQIKDARLNFMHSIGSCSFDEPVSDLQELGLIADD